MTRIHFADEPIPLRVKLSALWTAVTLCYLYGDYFELYLPNKVAGLLDGHNLLDSPIKLLLAAVWLSVPALMVVLSLVLKPALCRTLNIGLGLFFTLVMVAIGLMSLTLWRAFYVYMAAVESILTVVIVYYAWMWPRKQVSE